MSEGHTGRLEAALDGKYRIEHKLGEGGMGSVYLSEDLEHERTVAPESARSADFDISDDGQVVDLSGVGAVGSVERSFLWDRTGREESVGAAPRGSTDPRLSPDDGRLALDDRAGGATSSGSIWISDFATENLCRVIVPEGTRMYQVWTPDGERLACSAPDSPHIHWKEGNNTGSPEVMVADVGGDGSQQPEACFATTTPHSTASASS